MWFWLASTALAGTVYVNGVDVSTLRDFTLDGVTVHFDADGNVQITAPQYEIKVLSPDPDADAPAPTPAPTTRAMPQPSTRPAGDPVPAGNGVAEGVWWLVTEDDGSTGHVVDVLVNGVRAFTIRSGEEQRIEDVGPWLRPGTNIVTMRATSTNASGGSMYLYIGSGSNDEGTLTMGTPSVQFGLGASRQGAYEREYTLAVP